METNALIIIELIVVLGAVLAFGFWELHKLRRAKESRREAAEKDENGA